MKWQFWRQCCYQTSGKNVDSNRTRSIYDIQSLERRSYILLRIETKIIIRSGFQKNARHWNTRRLIFETRGQIHVSGVNDCQRRHRLLCYNWQPMPTIALNFIDPIAAYCQIWQNDHHYNVHFIHGWHNLIHCSVVTYTTLTFVIIVIEKLKTYNFDILHDIHSLNVFYFSVIFRKILSHIKWLDN